MVHETQVLNRLNAVQQNYQQKKASRKTACIFQINQKKRREHHKITSVVTYPEWQSSSYGNNIAQVAIGGLWI